MLGSVARIRWLPIPSGRHHEELLRPTRGGQLATVLVLATYVTATSACGTAELADATAGSAMDAMATHAVEVDTAVDCPWDPGFGQESCYQSDWWLEFSVADPSTESMQVEVIGDPSPRLIPLRTRIPLSTGHVKFTGGPGSTPVRAGSRVRVHAAQYVGNGGHTAASQELSYRRELPVVDCQSCIPVCAPASCGDNQCGGTCPCGAGELCLPDLSCCHPNTNPCGPDGCGGVHPDCPAEQVCVEGRCVCVPDCTDRACGDDGCGGSCGECPTGTSCRDAVCVEACVPSWSPVWRQTSYAGTWWVEYTITDGTVTSASFEIVGGPTVALRLRYGKWVGGTGVNVARGTPVRVHAQNSDGVAAQTLVFPYLIETNPQTDPCAGTAPPLPCEPLARGMLSINFDDSTDTQFTLARAPLQQRNVKVTTYHVSQALAESWNGYMTTAQAVLLAQDGHELGAHTISHPDLVPLSSTAIEQQLAGSKQWLAAHVGTPVAHFASPYGSYDSRVVDIARRNFASHRTVIRGLNGRGDTPYELKADTVTASMTPSAICALVAEASAQKGWRILLFHRFTSGTSHDPYTYPIAGFVSILDCALATAGLDIVTMTQGVERLRCPGP